MLSEEHRAPSNDVAGDPRCCENLDGRCATAGWHVPPSQPLLAGRIAHWWGPAEVHVALTTPPSAAAGSGAGVLFAHLRREWLSAAWRCYTPEPATHCEGTRAGRPPPAKTAVQCSHVATWNSAAESPWHPVNPIAKPQGHRIAHTAESTTAMPQSRRQHRPRRNRPTTEVLPKCQANQPSQPTNQPTSRRTRWSAQTAHTSRRDHRTRNCRSALRRTNEPDAARPPDPHDDGQRHHPRNRIQLGAPTRRRASCLAEMARNAIA